MTTTQTSTDLSPIAKLSRDLTVASVTLSANEARFLVDAYYQMQDNRIRSAAQVRTLAEGNEPHLVLSWLEEQSETLEKQIKRALDRYSMSTYAGQWAQAQIGIGPVIAAGLLAHIDIKKAPTVGHIWRLAGLDSTVEWLGKDRARALVLEVEEQLGENASFEDIARKCVERTNRKYENVARSLKGQTRSDLIAALSRLPWNASLKTLCWKMGESFVKVSGNPEARYGQLYVQRKLYEQKKNEAGDYADQAAKILQRKNIGKSTEAYKHYSAGHLPPAHIHARAKRWAVKMFLSHFHEVWFENEFGRKPPEPYAISIIGHAHKIEPTK